MSVLRPLPARPSLEYARKEAKLLLRRLGAGDPDAVARARDRHLGFSPANARLADAQLVVAREHGFASWPKLVRYMGDVERQQKAHVQLHGDRSEFEARVHHLLAQHRARAVVAGRTLAAYVPRFYGSSIAEVLANEVHDDDARLAVARKHGAPSWDVLIDRLDHDARNRTPTWELDATRAAREAMDAADVRALERIVEAHPELLQPSEHDITSGRTLMWLALGREMTHGVAALQPVMDWLAARGFDRQRTLDQRLCGHVWMSVAEVKHLLDRGADPGWIAPNGIPVLEHALIRYFNGEAVDVLAARTTPRDAFWVAAGLGDVERVSRFLDRRGKPTRAARQARPDFIAVGMSGFMPQLPDADDEEILFEALIVATTNGRARTLDFLISRGAPVNSLVYGTPLINLAAGNAMTAAAEALVRGGADIDLRGWNSAQSARDLARELFLQRPQISERRRMLEIFGMDPDALLAERDAQPAPPPALDPRLHRALAFAAADAVRAGRSDIGPENLLFGLLRNEGQALGFTKGVAGMDVERFRAELTDRLAIPEHATDQPSVALDQEAQAVFETAMAFGTTHRREVVGELGVLHALTAAGAVSVNALLTRYGVDVARLRSSLESML